MYQSAAWASLRSLVQFPELTMEGRTDFQKFSSDQTHTTSNKPHPFLCVCAQVYTHTHIYIHREADINIQ